MNVRLHTGDPCPCCGMPIATRDPDVLNGLSIFKGYIDPYGKRTCGQCRVAIGSECVTLCPFKPNDEPMDPDHVCDLTAVGDG